jgi:ferredoxin
MGSGASKEMWLLRVYLDCCKGNAGTFSGERRRRAFNHWVHSIRRCDVIVNSSKDEGYQKMKGDYFVNKDCIGCTACVNIAPNHFDMKKDGEMAFIKRQPKNDDERELCLDAKESCPAEAIKRKLS